MCVVCKVREKRKRLYEDLITMNLKMESARIVDNHQLANEIEHSMKSTFEDILENEHNIPGILSSQELDFITCVIKGMFNK